MSDVTTSVVTFTTRLEKGGPEHSTTLTIHWDDPAAERAQAQKSLVILAQAKYRNAKEPHVPTKDELYLSKLGVRQAQVVVREPTMEELAARIRAMSAEDLKALGITLPKAK